MRGPNLDLETLNQISFEAEFEETIKIQLDFLGKTPDPDLSFNSLDNNSIF